MSAQRREEEMAWIGAMFRTWWFRFAFVSVASHALWLLSSIGLFLMLLWDPDSGPGVSALIWMYGFCFAPVVSLCFLIFDAGLAYRRWPRTHPLAYTLIASLVGALAYYAFPICVLVLARLFL